MFYIVRKKVGNRVFDTYFEHWDNAEKFMLKDVEDGRKSGAVSEIKKERKWLPAKGFEEYNFYGIMVNGENVVWSLLEGYFSDHIVE